METATTMPKLCSVAGSKGRWNATIIMQGVTANMTTLLIAVEAWSSSIFAFPSTKPTTSSRYSVMIC